MKLSEELAWRGLIKDKTFGDNKWLDKSKAFYWGVDCSNDSLTIGNLAPLFLARRLAESGWKAILLIGGATSLIGDPGGKDEERELIKRETIKHNSEEIASQVSKLFAPQAFELVNNYGWWEGDGKDYKGKEYEGVKYLDFLREYGKRFSMTELMQREFVTERIGEGGSGISYAEFSYGLVQGYDFYQLKAKEDLDVILQIGGSDQWSNMLMGVALIRKKDNAEAHAMSMPLVINRATGAKFGKSEAGAIWLDPKKTSPTKFYQFWINVDDADSEDYLKIFTFLGKVEIEKILSEQKRQPAKRLAQQALAEEVTALVHGKEETHTAKVITDVLTGETAVGAVSPGVLAQMRREIPAVSMPGSATIIDALSSTGLATSNSEARRLLAASAIYANGKVIKDETHVKDVQSEKFLLRRGKAYKDSALIEKRT